MRQTMLRVVFLLVSLAQLANLSAQKGNKLSGNFAPDSLVQKLFEPSAARLQWIKYFSGRLDDVSDVDLVLGFDGKNCRGYMTYTESHARLRLEGTLEGAVLLLRELDANDETTGHITGTLGEKTLIADWTNYNNTIGSRLETEEVTVSKIGFSHCGDNKWINRYVSAYNGGKFEVTLCRANNGQIYGAAWIESGNLYYTFKGDMGENGNFSMLLKAQNGTDAGVFQGIMKNMQTLSLEWTSQANNKQFFNLSLKETLMVGCYEYADFLSSYDVLYPKTKCVSCNTWMERQVSAWINQCKSGFTARQQEHIPSNRATLRASAWADIALWTDELFCGTLTFTESWKDQPHGISFNFDFSVGKEITYNDLFIKNFDAKTWLRDYAAKEAQKKPEYEAKADFKTWIDKEGFPLFILLRDGMAMSTPFHPVFGQQQILIPYSVLKPYLKKESPVAGFVK